MTRADLDKKPAEVAAMFDALAGRYDLMNDILSMGQVRLWRRRVQRILQAGPGDRVLDLAAGTGTSSVVFARSGADVVACDFSLGMLQAGQARLLKKDPFQDKTRGRVSFAAGDALHLPFKDGAFDAVTISFGLRNVHGTRAALEEMRRAYRSFEAAWDTLLSAGVDVQEHTGSPFNSGLLLHVLAFQSTPGLEQETVLETIRPTVYYKQQLIQPGEVIVGTPEVSASSVADLPPSDSSE